MRFRAWLMLTDCQSGAECAKAWGYNTCQGNFRHRAVSFVARTVQRFPTQQRPAVFHFPLFNFSSTLSPVQPDKLETLDDLLAQAEHYAGFCLRNGGTMSPTLFLIGADGPVMFVPASLVDATEKDAFATTARLVCIAHAATVCVMALEAWMK